MVKPTSTYIRQRISINEGWGFYKYDSKVKADNFIYDIRPKITENNDNKAADSKPTGSKFVNNTKLKFW